MSFGMRGAHPRQTRHVRRTGRTPSRSHISFLIVSSAPPLPARVLCVSRAVQIEAALRLRPPPPPTPGGQNGDERRRVGPRPGSAVPRGGAERREVLVCAAARLRRWVCARASMRGAAD